MKGATTLLSFSSLLAYACAAPQQLLSPGAQEHVLRFSEAKTAQRATPTDSETNARANRAVELLLKDGSPAGDEALAALAGHYLGESTEPECEILERGPRMIPLLERFEQNPPSVSLPKSEAHSRAELANLIRAGKRCE